MSRTKDRIRNTHISHAIKIQGESINIDFARIVYRCIECFGELKRQDAGLVCVNDTTHRRFIHQRDVEAIKAEQARQLADVESAYKIKDGQVVPRGE